MKRSPEDLRKPAEDGPDEELRILILEDNPEHAELLEDDLRSAGFVFTAKQVEACEAFSEALVRFAPGLVLSDYDLPDFDGMQALKITKSWNPEIPFILVTGAIGEEKAIEILTSGATDYVLKNRMARLAPAVTRALHEVGERRKRKQAEEALRRAHDTLERRVRERTEELEAFTSSVSHDLRAPVWMLDEYIRMLLEDHGGRMDPDLEERIRTIWRTVGRMDRLIEDLLSLSRVNRAEISIAPFDLREVVLDAWREIGALHPGKEILFTLRELPPAAGDRNLIRQALYNLLSNSVKFSGQRPDPAIEVGGCTEGDHCVVYVRDNGVGFDMEQRDRLFGLFQRLHGSKFEGTGVGLAIVHRIIQRHGGFIRAEGEVDKGATFTFTLPQRFDKIIKNR